MALHAILKNTVGGLWWLEEATDSEIKDYEDYLLYIVDDNHLSGFHVCDKSALYDDMTGYEDLIQREDELKDDEFYVVLYDEYYKNDKSCGLLSSVDFGVTKQDMYFQVSCPQGSPSLWRTGCNRLCGRCGGCVYPVR